MHYFKIFLQALSMWGAGCWRTYGLHNWMDDETEWSKWTTWECCLWKTALIANKMSLYWIKVMRKRPERLGGSNLGFQPMICKILFPVWWAPYFCSLEVPLWRNLRFSMAIFRLVSTRFRYSRLARQAERVLNWLLPEIEYSLCLPG